MKKVISIILSLALFFSLSTHAFATSEIMGEELNKPYIQEIEDGNLFTLYTNTKSVAILTSNSKHLIDISIKYLNEDNTYHWNISDYPIHTFTPEINVFWEDIIEYAEQHMDDAEIVNFTEIIYDEPIDVTRLKSSAGADLLGDLEGQLGSEYSGRLKYSKTYQGQVFRAYESMDFRILNNSYVTWKTTITVSSLIVNILGKTTSNGTVKAVCSALGVVLDIAEKIEPGSMNKYIGRAMIYRYITINGSKYIYNITYRYIDYDGYEDRDINSTQRAYIDVDSQKISILDGASYYVSYDAQIEDAYEMFLRIGQKE